MARTGLILATAFAVGIGGVANPRAGAASADSTSPAAAADGLPTVGQGVQPLDLLALSAGDFWPLRGSLLEALSGADSGATEGALLDLAELHVARGMLVEARSYLDEVARTSGGAGEGTSYEVLDAIIGLLGNEREVSPGHRAFTEQQWPGIAHFSALAAVRAGAPLSETDIAAAVAAADHVPEGLLDRTLPVLFEASLEADLWAVSHDLAARILRHPELRDAAALHFLLGRAAEIGNENVAAFDSYRKAATGRDKWAHRARLAIVRLAERTGSLGARDQRELLRAARWIWSGDDVAGEILMRLAELEVSAGNQVEALTVLHDLQQRHPQSLFAQKSQALSRSLIGSFYKAGTSGQMPLPEFVAGHARIASDRRLNPGFALKAEVLADLVLAKGITSLAAREYAETAAYLVAAEDLGLANGTGLDRDRLRLKQADALLRGGQFGQAQELIDAPMIAPSNENRARRDALRIRLYSETGQHSDLIALESAPAASDLQRRTADALFEAGEWSGALAAYEALWAMTGEAMPLGAAAQMVLAAHRTGDTARLREIVLALPDLDAAPDWEPIAATLARERPDLLPLRADVFEDALNGAGESKYNKEQTRRE